MDGEAPRPRTIPVRGASLEGLWVLLVPEGESKVPVCARAGNGLYLLAFRTGHTARKFLEDSKMDAEPRMVVPTNLTELMSSLSGKGVAGVLVDYDASTNPYKEPNLVY